MIDRDSPVTEDELHAYIDGELPADRMEAVTAWLAAHPEQAVTVASWRAQSERIRRVTVRSSRKPCRSGSSSTK